MLYKSDKKCCFNKYRNDIITKTWPEMDKTYMRVYIIEFAVHNSLKYNTLDDYSFFLRFPRFWSLLAGPSRGNRRRWTLNNPDPRQQLLLWHLRGLPVGADPKSIGQRSTGARRPLPWPQTVRTTRKSRCSRGPRTLRSQTTRYIVGNQGIPGREPERVHHSGL